jgi:kinesin family protein 6/9
LHNATQDDVYDLSSAGIVSNSVAGYNGTVMCYGQTGSGKTFSMLGLTNNYKQRGIVPRAIQQVYHEISSKFDQAITIKVSYIEIYNERMIDLLAPPENIGVVSKQLSIMEDARGGVAVKNLSLHICENEEDALN